MHYSFTSRRVPKGIKLSSAIYFSLLLYYESLSYTLLPWTWPSTSTLERTHPEVSVHDNQPTLLRVLLSADPQIQGVKNEPQGFLGVITRWDSDRYLRRTFSQVVKHTDPHLVIFLGDLLDEGTITTGPAYVKYAERFHDTFPLPKQKVIYVPGDNDIGGEGGELVTDQNIAKFRENFKSAGSGFWDKTIEFVEVSGLTDVVPLSNTSEAQRSTILLAHIPVLSRRPHPEVLKTLEQLKPTVVFSAHSHKASASSQAISGHVPPRPYLMDSDFTVFDLSTSPVRVQEIVVPTCSYRMGVPEMGYGYAVIDLTNNRLYYTVLWLPSRYSQLFMELGLTAIFSLLILATVVIQNCRPAHRRKGRFIV